jgi:hypothetical protein
MSKFFYVDDTSGKKRLLNSDRVNYLLADDGRWEKGSTLMLLPGGSGQPDSISLSAAETVHVQRWLESIE